jgi:hypothetical protein
MCLCYQLGIRAQRERAEADVNRDRDVDALALVLSKSGEAAKEVADICGIIFRGGYWRGENDARR